MSDPATSETTRHAIRELAELEPRAWIGFAADRLEWPDGVIRHGYPLELAPGAIEGMSSGTPSSVAAIVPTSGAHAHVSTPSSERTLFVHRGRSYLVHFSQHVYRHADGTWHLEHPDPEQNDTRNGAGRLYGADELPAAGRERLRAAILEAVRAWALLHPEYLELADVAALNNAAQRRESKVKTTAAELLADLEELEAISTGAQDAPRY